MERQTRPVTPKTTQAPAEPAREPEIALVREAVGAFRSADALEQAVSTLASSGWDRSEMSLVAQHGMFAPTLPADGKDMHRAADDPNVDRSPVVSKDDVRQGRTLATSLAMVVAAFAASGATILTGGGALAALVGAAAAGGGAAAAVNAVGRWAGGSREMFLRDEIEQGGILLWVKVRNEDQATKATEILRRCGATDVHLHEVPAT
jgi:hypothetical protein